MRTVLKIIVQPKYFLITVLVSLAVITFAAWLPNLHLVTGALFSNTISVGQKLDLLSGLSGSIMTNFTLFSRTITIVTGVLVGVQTSLLVYFLRRSYKLQKTMSASFVGVLSSMLGVGCASCGSVVLTTLIGFGSTAAVISFLPFKGQEFGILGIGVLLLVIVLTSRKINSPVVCVIKN